MKERMTINAPNELTQSYMHIVKEFDLLKSKYENLLLENSVLYKYKEQNRV